MYVHNHDGARDQKIPFGAYMFFLFGQDPIAQAKHFLECIDGRQGTLRPFVDVEEGSGSTGSVQGNIEALAAFNAQIKTAFGKQPMIYTNADTWNTTMGGTDAFAGHDFILADFSSPQGKPYTPQGVKSVVVHQYSETGVLPGVSVHVDLDSLLVDIGRILR